MCEPVPIKRGNPRFRQYQGTLFSEWMVASYAQPCCACEETIRAGQFYHAHWKAVSLFHSVTYVHCVRCWKMFRAVLGRVDKGCGVRYRLDCGQTWDSAFGEEPPADVAALAFALPGDFPVEVDAEGKVTLASEEDT